MADWFGALAAGTLIATAGTGPAIAAGDNPLANHLWRSRVLVISAPAADDAALHAQRHVLASVRRSSAERDLVVLEAVGTGPSADALRRRLGIGEGSFRAVLVGKDGGEKLSSAKPITPQTLFATIDTMPMRRDEMRKR